MNYIFDMLHSCSLWKYIMTTFKWTPQSIRTIISVCGFAVRSGIPCCGAVPVWIGPRTRDKKGLVGWQEEEMCLSEQLQNTAQWIFKVFFNNWECRSFPAALYRENGYFSLLLSLISFGGGCCCGNSSNSVFSNHRDLINNQAVRNIEKKLTKMLNPVF